MLKIYSRNKSSSAAKSKVCSVVDVYVCIAGSGESSPSAETPKASPSNHLAGDLEHMEIEEPEDKERKAMTRLCKTGG